MKKRVLPLLLALAMCLGMLPHVALAADEYAPYTTKTLLYVWSWAGNVGNGNPVTVTFEAAKTIQIDAGISYPSENFSETLPATLVLVKPGSTVTFSFSIVDEEPYIGGAAKLRHNGNNQFSEVYGISRFGMDRTTYTVEEFFSGSSAVWDGGYAEGEGVYVPKEPCLFMLETLYNGFDINGDGVLNLYTGPGGDVVIPDIVTAIGDYAFYADTNVTSVVIPDGVTSIGEAAFASCINLTSVTIPDSVTTIGDNAFWSCSSLAEVTIPDSVTSLGGDAFGDTPWIKTQGEFATFTGMLMKYQGTDTDVTVPNSVTSIGGWAFLDCEKVASVTVPSTVTAIGSYAFADCANLEQVTILNGDAEIALFGLNNYLSGGNISATVLAPAGGKVEAYCKANGITFAPLTATAKPSNDKLTVDGVAQVPAAYKINDNNYIQLRDIAMMLSQTAAKFSVGYDGTVPAITITTGEDYEPRGDELSKSPSANAQAKISNDTVYINGEKANLTVYKIDGSNYFKLRDLGKALGFNVSWNAEVGAYIESDKPYEDENKATTEPAKPVEPDDPTGLSASEILDIAYALADGQTTEKAYTLEGTITSIDVVYSPDYNNITVTIAVSGDESRPVQCYRLSGPGAENLAVGQVITVTGNFSNYRGTIEFIQGCTLDAVR